VCILRPEKQPKMERKQELEELLKKIDESKTSDVHFDELYKELKRELTIASKKRESGYLSDINDVLSESKFFLKKNTSNNYNLFITKFYKCIKHEYDLTR
jgi:hypothetical protein